MKTGTITMADRAFVDSNVLLRALFTGMNDHEACQSTLDRLIEAGYELWISHQVVREFSVNATVENTFTREDAPVPHYDQVVDIVTLLPVQFAIAEEGTSVSKEFLNLMREFRITGKPLHDANIVATMRVNEIDRLATRNERHFRRFDTIQLISPSRHFTP